MKPQVSPDVTDLEVKSDMPPPKKPVRHRQWGGAVAGLLLGIFALALGRAGHLWPAFDVAAQFGAQALCLACGFTLALLFPRFKAMVGIVVSGGLILTYGLWPIVTSQSLSKGPFRLEAGERLARVVQFNVFVQNRDVGAIVEELRRLDADVVTLEEIEDTKREVLFRLRTDYPYQYDCHEIPGCQFAILSREPILAVNGTEQLTGPPFISATLGGRLSGVTVYAVHMLRFPHSRAQLIQANALAKRLESETGTLLIMGDFNATPFSRVTSVITQSTGLKRLSYLPSWPAWSPVPQLAIDHVFASPGVRPLAPPQVGRPAGSDHLPVVINLAIPN